MSVLIPPRHRAPQSLVRPRVHEPWLWRQQRLAALNKQRSEAVPLRNHVQFIHRYRWWVAVSLVLGLAIGVLADHLHKPTWVSGATVLAPAVALDPQTTPDKTIRPRRAVTIDTEAAIMTSYLVLPRAVAGTGLTPGYLSHEVSVIAAPHSRVIKIQVQDKDPARAELLVTNLADAYLDARRQLLTNRRSEQVAAVQREIAALSREAKDVKIGTLGSRSASTASIGFRMGQLRGSLVDLQSQEVLAGELLRSATEARKVPKQPEVRVLSWAMIFVLLGAALITWREHRPPAPRDVDAITRIPMASDLPVAVLEASRAVDDSHGGWVRISDAIGPKPATTLIVSLDSERVDHAVDALSLALRRRGYVVSPMIDTDQESPAPNGATAIMLRTRTGGQHLVGAGPQLKDLDHSLSTTQADGVVLMFAPGSVPQRDIDIAIERVVRFGVPVMGVILDQAHTRRRIHLRWARWPRFMTRGADR